MRQGETPYQRFGEESNQPSNDSIVALSQKLDTVLSLQQDKAKELVSRETLTRVFNFDGGTVGIEAVTRIEKKPGEEIQTTNIDIIFYARLWGELNKLLQLTFSVLPIGQPVEIEEENLAPDEMDALLNTAQLDPMLATLIGIIRIQLVKQNWGEDPANLQTLQATTAPILSEYLNRTTETRAVFAIGAEEVTIDQDSTDLGENEGNSYFTIGAPGQPYSDRISVYEQHSGSLPSESGLLSGSGSGATISRDQFVKLSQVIDSIATL